MRRRSGCGAGRSWRRERKMDVALACTRRHVARRAATAARAACRLPAQSALRCAASQAHEARARRADSAV
eukprot:scaffold15718_cov107-Isochrysis_galbana.AAC.5